MSTWWAPRTSNPLWGVNRVPGGFDSHTFPLIESHRMNSLTTITADTNMKDKTALFRLIPKVDQVLELPEWRELGLRWGQGYAVAGVRAALEVVRAGVAADEVTDVGGAVELALGEECDRRRLMPLQRVINATGVILHTNLGRAPLGFELLEAAAETAAGATNLEIDVLSGKRGVRGAFVREALAELCGAEDALVVNNNAAGVLLALSALAGGREVIVSRGELVQIGGGFRIPDVIQQGGARLREVGATNITTLDDFSRALGPDTGAILKVHLSNFHMGGFVSRPTTAELAQLKSDTVLFIEDLGSGNLTRRFEGAAIQEPTPKQVLAAGADLVCFSGDKLLGGPQAGLIAGRKELIDELLRHPFMRAVRPDKLVYAILQEVLAVYRRGTPQRLAPWRMMAGGRAEVLARIHRFLDEYGLVDRELEVVETVGEYGSGSMPGGTIPSAALVLTRTDAPTAASALRRMNPPVLAVVSDGACLLDFLSLQPWDEPALAGAIHKLSGSMIPVT